MDLRALSNLLYRNNLYVKHQKHERLQKEIEDSSRMQGGPHGRMLDAFPVTADTMVVMFFNHLVEASRIC